MGDIVKIILKAGLIGFLALIVLFAAFMGFAAWISNSNNQVKGDNEEILKSEQSNPKKALLVYQPSKTGAASEIAHQIAKGLNEKGYEVTMNYPGKNLSYDTSKYSLLVFGSPVYIGKVSSALTDYMKGIKDAGDKKVIIYTVGGSKETKELDILGEALYGSKQTIKEKFMTSDKTKAYELGKKIAEE